MTTIARTVSTALSARAIHSGRGVASMRASKTQTARPKRGVEMEAVARRAKQERHARKAIRARRHRSARTALRPTRCSPARQGPARCTRCFDRSGRPAASRTAPAASRSTGFAAAKRGRRRAHRRVPPAASFPAANAADSCDTKSWSASRVDQACPISQSGPYAGTAKRLREKVRMESRLKVRSRRPPCPVGAAAHRTHAERPRPPGPRPDARRRAQIARPATHETF